MPPFLSATCTNPKCGHSNRFDLAELKKNSVLMYKTVVRGEDEEYIVTCAKCGQRFKISVKGGQDETPKDTTRG